MNAQKLALIVDDESDIRRGVCYWLAAAGYKTLNAEEGEQGYCTAQIHKPHVILLDVQMPIKDGLQTLKELKSNPTTKRIPVVMLSASLRDELHALDAGARFFVQKPYDGKKLLATVEAAIAQSDASAAEFASVGI